MSEQDLGKEVPRGETPSKTEDGFVAPHTPTPWHVLGGGRIDAGDGMVASVLNHPGASPNRDVYVQKANATFIVRAVNSHDDLLAALKALKRAVAAEVIIHGAGCTGEYLKAEDQASAAVLKAETLT